MSDLRSLRPQRTTYLVARLRNGACLKCRDPFHVRSRFARSSAPNSSKLSRCAIRDRVAPIIVVAPSMGVARYKPKFHRHGARDTPRASIACPVSGEDLVPPSTLRSQRTTAGMGPGLCVSSPHPDGRVSAASSWSLLSSWHRFRNHPKPPTCPPLPCRGSSLGLRRRSQGPRANMDRVVLKARSQSQAFRATCSTFTKLTVLRTE
jgi:hypothetical protein